MSTYQDFIAFFSMNGKMRLDGLSKSYLEDLSESEKEQAWSFLKEEFSLSDERISALNILNRAKAIELFKEALDLPARSSKFPAEQEAIERNRLLMVRCVNDVEPNDKYIEILNGFALSQFPKIRAQFAQSLPVQQVAESAINAIKGMIFTEAERIPLASAIVKFMEIHQMSYDLENPLYKSIYLSLRSDDQKKKSDGMKRLERLKPIDES